MRAAAAAVGLICSINAASADPLRFASFNADLNRRGPGLLLRDIQRGDDPQVQAVISIIGQVAPDVLLLTDFDWDLEGRALAALADQLAQSGRTYPYWYAPRPNSGLMTELDLDGDGRVGGPRDAQGFGRFTGEGGMALLSRWPIATSEAVNFTEMLWRDLPGAMLPAASGQPFPSAQAQAIQRLSSVGHWAVPVATPTGAVHVLAYYATPPVFDGPEDLNGLRNHDEAALWLRWFDGGLDGALDGAIDGAAPDGPLVLLADTNLDPVDGNGRPDALNALLAHPRLRDVAPTSEGGIAATARQGGVNANHTGDPARDTADWDDTIGSGGNAPGNLRVDFVLPSSDLTVLGAGVHWPLEGPAQAEAEAASRHRLVWVDIEIAR